MRDARIVLLNEGTGEEFQIEAAVMIDNNPHYGLFGFPVFAAGLTLAAGDYSLFVVSPAGASDVKHVKVMAGGVTRAEVEYLLSTVRDVSSTNQRDSQRANVISTRMNLVGKQQEPQGAGLYSYLLVPVPPSQDEKARYIAILKNYMRKMLPEEEVREYSSLKYLNIIMLPLKVKPKTLEPNAILNVYNYPRAAALLSKVPGGPHTSGPYLVSTMMPLILLDSGSVLIEVLTTDPESEPGKRVSLVRSGTYV